jgi:hypothetical protein
MPVPAYTTFYGITSIGGAWENLKNELKSAHGVDFIPPTALTAALYTEAFLWDQPDLPSHISYFLCVETGHLGSSRKEYLQLHLKSEGAVLSSAEIKSW